MGHASDSPQSSNKNVWLIMSCYYVISWVKIYADYQKIFNI